MYKIKTVPPYPDDTVEGLYMICLRDEANKEVFMFRN
ncbi:hypothetical protein Asal01_02632 [Fodinibius salicampi]